MNTLKLKLLQTNDDIKKLKDGDAIIMWDAPRTYLLIRYSEFDHQEYFGFLYDWGNKIIEGHFIHRKLPIYCDSRGFLNRPYSAERANYQELYNKDYQKARKFLDKISGRNSKLGK